MHLRWSYCPFLCRIYTTTNEVEASFLALPAAIGKAPRIPSGGGRAERVWAVGSLLGTFVKGATHAAQRQRQGISLIDELLRCSLVPGSPM